MLVIRMGTELEHLAESQPILNWQEAHKREHVICFTYEIDMMDRDRRIVWRDNPCKFCYSHSLSDVQFKW